MQHRGAKRIVGIAVDASPRQTGRVGRSEDIMLLEVTDWTDDLIADRGG